MKNYILFFFTFFLICNNVSAQILKPSEFKALVNITVTNLENQPLADELVLFVSSDKQVEEAVKTNEKGKAQVLLPKGKTYDVKYKDLIEKISYSSFEVPKRVGKYSFDIGIKYEPSDVVELKGMIFSEKGTIDEMSAMELDMMKEVLVLNPKMEILIAVHSDNSEGKEKSIEKTQKQADMIKEYFVKKGISKDRVKAKGFGYAEPIAPNALPEGRQKNNRIEIRVTKKYL